ncbi:MAG: MCE family protein [Proteobacteria bacterium]|nr:MCE family protein [Pseudomonadota bacterium]
MTTAQVRKNRGISAIWTLPLIALCICVWLVYSSYKNAGVEITIFFADATGIVPGKTQVMARGIPIGLVTKILPDLDNRQIQAKVKMEKSVVEHLVEDTLFWIVRPELSASSIHGLETILSGSYIGIQVGTSTNPLREFAGLASAPPVSRDTPGLHVKIRAKVLGSIQVGTGIYYRNIQIGAVQRYELEGDKNILIDVFIKPEFTHLVREGSRFSNASGIQISGKLPSLKIQVESLASLLRGGILLHTPEPLATTPYVQNGHMFTLYPDSQSANYGIPMTLTLTSSEDIIEGSTKVIYRGLEAGFVKEIQINNDAKRSVTAHILLDPRTELILRENTKFWLVKPEISAAGFNNIQLLLSGAHITFQPGSGEFKDHFDILSEPPPQIPLRPGKTMVLSADGPVDISPKSAVYYKNIQVGEVVDVGVDKAGMKIRSSLFIYQDYLKYLSKKSVFWVESGVEVRGSLAEGVSLATGPLAKMLHGGVSFTTPDIQKKRKHVQPEEGFEFRLHNSYREAVAEVSDLQPGGKRVVLIAPDAESLATGSPILHKNIKIGEVESFRLSHDQKSVLIDCLVFDEFKNIVRPYTRFYNTSGLQVSGGLDGIRLQTGSLQSVLTGGIGCLNPSPGPISPPPGPYPLFANLQDALHADEIELKVMLDSIKGLKEGSEVRYQGIEIGKVSTLRLGENNKTIIATTRIQEHVAALFRSNTKIWVEQAEFNLSGVKNAETLIFGSFLNILPGEGKPVRILKALAEPPLTEIAGQDGLGIILEAGHLGSLGVGSPVYYRQLQVGEITGYDLSPSFQKVRIFVNIRPQYMAIIRANTRFWQVSGARIEGGIFSGVTVSAESLTAIIRGGIALATPDGEHTGPAISAGHLFSLYDQPEKQWLDWSPDVVLLEQEPAQELPAKNSK